MRPRLLDRRTADVTELVDKLLFLRHTVAFNVLVKLTLDSLLDEVNCVIPRDLLVDRVLPSESQNALKLVLADHHVCQPAVKQNNVCETWVHLNFVLTNQTERLSIVIYTFLLHLLTHITVS